MINGKKVLAVIPARGGSKRLPNKNKLKLAGKELISWTLEAALDSKYIDKVILSTDDTEILAIGNALGVGNQNGLRPGVLSSDTAKTHDVIKYELTELDEYFDLIVLLQPTSPFRQSYHIDEALELFSEGGSSSVISVCECEHPPEWSAQLTDNNTMANFSRDNNKRSQDIKLSYRLNGAIYIYKSSDILSGTGFLIGNDTKAYIMDRASSIDIDTELDFMLAELMAKKFI